jgi:glutathione S-transferase
MEKQMNEKEKRAVIINTCFKDLIGLTFKIIETNIFKDDSQFICGNFQTPVDYYLSCELNTTMILLDKVISASDYPRLARWWNVINHL